MSDCPFCARVAAGEVLAQTRQAVAFPDGFPLTRGHLLVVPRRHAARLERLDPDEWSDLFELVRDQSRRLSALPGVEGINVGVNSGAVAGQTVAHAHVHIIPRRLGDVLDPRGGVRCVVPGRAAYWEAS